MTQPTATTTNQHAVDETRQRVRELLAVANVLKPDADDPRCLSELTAIQAELARARAELSTLRDNQRHDR